MEVAGHDPEVFISALVHNRTEDKFLVTKRQGESPEGILDAPYGKLEYGEIFTACAAREVRRQTALEVNAKAVVSVRGDLCGGIGWEKHYITIFVLCDLKDDRDGDEIIPAEDADESDEWVWKTWDELRHEKVREVPLPLANILEENITAEALLNRSL